MFYLEKLLFYDVLGFGIFGGDNPILALVDEINQIHFLKLRELWNTQIDSAADKKWTDIWKFRLNQAKNTRKQKLKNRRRGKEISIYFIL